MKFHMKPTGWLVTIIAAIAILAGGMLVMPDHYTTSAAGSQPEQTQMVPRNFTQLAEDAGAAVVNIRTVKTVEGGGQMFRHFFGPDGPNQQQRPFDEFFERFFGDQNPREFKRRSLGSGFVLDKEGHIVTNHHVIKDADEIQVKLQSGKEYDAEIIGTDESTDLALIKIPPEADLPTLELGNSKKAKIGQWVVAIGNPFGLDHTVTAGIISAKGRVIGAGPYDDFIQTDASINPGNSGGPLLNMNGEVIGINTAIVAAGQGIGFAIPSDLASDIISQLKQSGEVTRGWLGVGIQELNPELREYYDVDQGVLVTQVFAGDPAAEAGIKPNDIITAINGKSVDSPRELSKLVADIQPGEEAKIRFVRDGKTKTATVTLVKRDAEKMAERGETEPEGSAKASLGMDVAEITSDIAKQYNLENTEGVIVAGVEPESKAYEAGFKRGDIIREINHQPVKSVRDFRQTIDKAEKGDALYFYVLRARQGITIIKLTK
ncbi:MAG: DegQ family serine endoprotease [Desulfobacteraceae bacterium]|nr:DegQ family serine endoprotease [Desulfobacteraceae bacterium]